MKIKIENTVFVFDLDDTLFQEADYHASGVNAVGVKLDMLFKHDAQSLLKSLVAEGEKDLWGSVCERLKLPSSVKESLLWEYRLHLPQITLRPAVKLLLEMLKSRSLNVSILTDGRAVTQRLKLAALGLGDLPVYISEDFGAPKPHPERFQLIANQYPSSNFIYIGDNPKKDFVTPNAMGWTTFGVIGNSRNIHSQDLNGLDFNFHPNYWLAKPEDLQNFLC